MELAFLADWWQWLDASCWWQRDWVALSLSPASEGLTELVILQLPSVTPHRGRGGGDIRLIFILYNGYPRKSTMLCVFTFLWDSITFTFAVPSFKRVTLHWRCTVWKVYGYNLVNGGRFYLICQLVQKYIFGSPWKMGFLSISGHSVHAPHWFWLPQPATGSD